MYGQMDNDDSKYRANIASHGKNYQMPAFCSVCSRILSSVRAGRPYSSRPAQRRFRVGSR